ncbi:hypothetical protein DV515_00002177 [Chloebia gouldiae]|uniref:Uncharacterized protein n=1 Tax=Chloebia gouldiae TaxID=44316 RepID=A0A3L8SXJ0_CHLGU|nr:hypothetical protein DV515_00002177 [Chloebia gouldiae]
MPLKFCKPINADVGTITCDTYGEFNSSAPASMAIAIMRKQNQIPRQLSAPSLCAARELPARASDLGSGWGICRDARPDSRTFISGGVKA